MSRALRFANGIGFAVLFASSFVIAKDVTVSADGSGDFTTVQSAIDAAPKEESNVIHLKPGTYKEKLIVSKSKSHISFKGEGDDPSKVVLTYDLKASSVLPAATQPVGTSGSTSTLIEGSDITAENVTFENSAGDIGQAVALKTTGDRLVFRTCRFIGWQDTLYPHGGRCYFVDCYIEGRTDFIFGRSTALFERCHIHSKNGGFVTAAATMQEQPFGFVFLDCKLDSEGDAKAYLGRPWRDYAAVAFVKCELGVHINPEGWHEWSGREKTARYFEYQCTGPGADRSKRVTWSGVLDDESAKKITEGNVLAGTDNWNPRQSSK